ncbi:MAG: hypothetical protein RhofKO_09460 [Rhodothermales bacterium]
MALLFAQLLSLALGIYVLLGLVFAIVFVTKGAAAIDPNAQEGTWGFKLLIIPGAMAMWPWLLKRWRSGQDEPPPTRSTHYEAACLHHDPFRSA